MIRSLDDITQNFKRDDKILILYSGGLDGTYLIAKLKELGYTNLLAIHFDLSGDDNIQINDRLKKLEVNYEIINVVDKFIDEYVFEAVKMKALYNGVYPVSASLSRPVISESVISYIKRNNLDSPLILHTSNSSQNSLRRFNGSLYDLGYKGLYGTPFERTHISRLEKLSYLKSRQIAFNLKVASEDSNIWCREFEYGDYDNVEDINIPDEAYAWTRKKEAKNETLKIDFFSGIPHSLNDSVFSKKEIILGIRNSAGKFGIGRYVGLEEINTGQRVLEVREAPSASILIDAYRMLEMSTFSYDIISKKTKDEQDWIKEASEGRWFGVLRQEISKKVNEMSTSISGSVTYQITENHFYPISIKSKNPNYINNRDEFELSQNE